VSFAWRAVDGARALDDAELVAHALGNLGLAAEDDGQLDEAAAVWRELQELGVSNGEMKWQARALSGHGRLAFIRGEFIDAAEQYARAARAYETVADLDAARFALGGRLESLSRAGDADGLEEAAQRLVDAVGRSEEPAEAITYFGRSAISWIQHGKTEEAVFTLAAAVQLGAQAFKPAGASDDSVDAFRPLFEAVCFAVLAAREAGGGEDEVYDVFTSHLETVHAGLAELVGPVLDQAREAMKPD
jgi:tetratricopeptide (TPR) repeat protein